MKKLWLLLFLVSLSECTEVQLPANLSTEPALNTTTLYPVSESNITQKETSSPEPKLKTEATAWKIDAAYSVPKEDEKNETSKEAGKSVNASEEFRPSPHLGSFYEVEGSQIPPTQVPLDFNPVLNKPSDLHIPPNRFRPEFPYKMESPVFTRAVEPWKPSSFEAQPTAESPAKVPAGGLYKIHEPFNKDKPGLGDDFALDLNGHKDTTTLLKRPSPWKGLLNLVTAFLPVGLIISALTPSLITIHDSDNPYPDHGFRRRAEPVPPLPAISEQCRRRLLCELHNEKNYGTLSRRKPKRCYKIPCDDPAALSTTLNWLLSHQPHRPEDLTEPFT